MANPFFTNLSFAILTVILSFVVLILVVGHPEPAHSSEYVGFLAVSQKIYLVFCIFMVSLLRVAATAGRDKSINSVATVLDLLAELDAYIIAPDRSGYGESSVTVGRNLESTAVDMIEFLDNLNIDKIFLVGASGGGPHALALAAAYPERIRGILALSAACESGLFHADRMQDSEQAPDPKIFSFYRFLRRHEWMTRQLQRLSETYAVGRGIYSLFLENFSKQALAGFTDADRRCAVLTLKGLYLTKIMPGALKQGIGTPIIQDIVSLLLPSSVNISSIPERLQRATFLWHSDHDPQVNPVCLEDYRSMLPAAKTRSVENGGHFAYWSCNKELQREAFTGLITRGITS